MYRAIVAGSVVLDIAPIFKKDGGDESFKFMPGRQFDLAGLKMNVGGCVGNTGVALHKLGVPVRTYGKVGNDDFGRIIIQNINRYGIESKFEIVSEESTTCSIVISNCGSDRMILHHRGAGQTFNISDFDFNDMEGFRLFHFGYPPTMKMLWDNEGSGLLRMLKALKKMKIVTSIDLCNPSGLGYSGEYCKAVLKKCLPYIDIFVPSIEELMYMLHWEEYINLCNSCGKTNLLDVIPNDIFPLIAEELLDFGGSIICLKMGKKGLYFRSSNAGNIFTEGLVPENWAGRELWMPPCQVSEISSTTGAGDTAIAGFIAAFLSEYPPELALKIASCTAAFCLQTDDAVSGIPTLEEVKRMAESDFPQECVSVVDSGWVKKDKVYFGPRDLQ